MSNEDNTIPVLMYHEVTDYPEIKKKIRRIDPDYSLSADSFHDHMTYLFDEGYRTISCDELLNYQFPVKRQCVLTFDDGLIGNYQIAFPICKKFGFKATIFVVVSGICTSRFMNWAQLCELTDNGFSIQSHTMTHADLNNLNEHEILYELSESKKILEKNVGGKVEFLSLPFGSGNKTVLKIARDLGYRAVFTSAYYQMNLNYKPAIFGRIPVKASDSMQTYEYLISKKDDQLRKLMIIGMIKDRIKEIIGLNNYRKVYRLFYRIKLD